MAITLDNMPTVTTLGDRWPVSGFIMIEKVNSSETGMFENEVIEYTGRTNRP